MRHGAASIDASVTRCQLMLLCAICESRSSHRVCQLRSQNARTARRVLLGRRSRFLVSLRSVFTAAHGPANKADFSCVIACCPSSRLRSFGRMRARRSAAERATGKCSVSLGGAPYRATHCTYNPDQQRSTPLCIRIACLPSTRAATPGAQRLSAISPPSQQYIKRLHDIQQRLQQPWGASQAAGTPACRAERPKVRARSTAAFADRAECVECAGGRLRDPHTRWSWA